MPGIHPKKFRISNFGFAVLQLASSAGKPQSAWRCRGGPRREGRETWSAGALWRATWPRIAGRSRGLQRQRRGRRSRRTDLGANRTGPRPAESE